jgi:hypothetical protein
LTSGTSYTTPANCNKIFVEAVGGGSSGQGSGGAAIGGQNGGGSGGYAAKYFTVTPSTSYTYAIGAGGIGPSSISYGNGGNTTFTVGATTIIGERGVGATPGKGINGDINITGEGGQVGTGSASPLFGGAGGSSFFGPGGAGILGVTGDSKNGRPGTRGGGGGGAADASSSVSYTGGNGGAGIIRIWEFT